jgi:hypothetical protein
MWWIGHPQSHKKCGGSATPKAMEGGLRPPPMAWGWFASHPQTFFFFSLSLSLSSRHEDCFHASANNVHLFQTRQSSFKCQMSPLNPLTRSSSSLSQPLKRPETSTEITRFHLANLEKLLQTSAPVDRQPVLKDVSDGSMDIKATLVANGASTMVATTGKGFRTRSTRISCERWSGTASLSKPPPCLPFRSRHVGSGASPAASRGAAG